MDYFLFDFSGVQFHYTMSHKILYANEKSGMLENKAVAFVK